MRIMMERPSRTLSFIQRKNHISGSLCWSLPHIFMQIQQMFSVVIFLQYSPFEVSNRNNSRVIFTPNNLHYFSMIIYQPSSQPSSSTISIIFIKTFEGLGGRARLGGREFSNYFSVHYTRYNYFSCRNLYLQNYDYYYEFYIINPIS